MISLPAQNYELFVKTRDHLLFIIPSTLSTMSGAYEVLSKMLLNWTESNNNSYPVYIKKKGFAMAWSQRYIIRKAKVKLIWLLWLNIRLSCLVAKGQQEILIAYRILFVWWQEAHPNSLNETHVCWIPTSEKGFLSLVWFGLVTRTFGEKNRSFFQYQFYKRCKDVPHVSLWWLKSKSTGLLKSNSVHVCTWS